MSHFRNRGSYILKQHFGQSSKRQIKWTYGHINWRYCPLTFFHSIFKDHKRIIFSGMEERMWYQIKTRCMHVWNCPVSKILRKNPGYYDCAWSFISMPCQAQRHGGSNSCFRVNGGSTQWVACDNASATREDQSWHWLCQYGMLRHLQIHSCQEANK